MPSWSAVSCFKLYKSNTLHKDESMFGDRERQSGITSVAGNSKRRVIVTLVKKQGNPLGLIISGGIDKGSRPQISNFRPGSIAHRCDSLAVGDYLIAVNGIHTSKLRHEEIVTLLKNTDDKVMLELEYDMPNSCSKSLFVYPKVIQLKLEKENDSFGFTLRECSFDDKCKTSALIITHVRTGGPADKEGCIKVGDRLLAIDGTNVANVSLQEALVILRHTVGDVILTIEYDVAIIEAVKNASGPLLVEIDKTSGNQLGLSLTSLAAPKPSVVIESIRQASVAERCGALHVGDYVLTIDGVNVDLFTAEEAMELLKSPSGDVVKLEILPVSQMAYRHMPESHVKRNGTIPHYIAARSSYTNSYYNTLSSLDSFSVGSNIQFCSKTPPLLGNRCDRIDCTPMMNHMSPSSSNASLITSINAAFSCIGHTDITEIRLLSGHKGFGFSIKAPSPSDILTSPPIISSIDCEGPAEKCGTLQVGDRILAINNVSTEGVSLDEVIQMVMQSHPEILLKTEFDVAEAVVPSSGIFVVKLAKRSSNIGISLTAPKSRQSGEPLIISAVVRGSVAYRSGTIQPGDKLLAIDHARMENCTPEDAYTILSSCSEIATLRIRKDETFSDDPDATSTTVYTLELARHGGPLGITVSGTEEPFDPIIISSLVENGLAQRTGAVHVGDRILAINGVSLRGKPLSEAIQILQSCSDTVTLKISRTSNTNSERGDSGSSVLDQCRYCGPESIKTHTTPLPSVDSAVESWGSCNLDACGGSKIDSKLEDLSSSKDSLLPADYHISVDSPHNVLQQCHHGEENNSSFTNVNNNCSKLLVSSGGENWSKVLEDLKTCGESQLLRQIEQKILGPTESQVHSNTLQPNDNGSVCSSQTLSEHSLKRLSIQIEQLGSDLNRAILNEAILPAHDIQPTCSLAYADFCDNSYINCPSSSFTLPLPIEVHKVTLFKDKIYEDFGFSVSDGLYEHGVYINRIRTDGPADLSGLIKPYDRILQVNNIKTFDHDCCLTVPLIAASGDRIELVISRPAFDAGLPFERSFSTTCEHLQCAEGIDYQGKYFPSHSDVQRLTKAL